MDNKQIQEFIEQLRSLEGQLTDNSENIDDVNLVSDLDKLLQALSNDIRDSYDNPKLNVKIKKLVPEAVIPIYAKPGDAGMDLTATSSTFDKDGNVIYGTGLSMEIPKGYVGLLFPRSSVANKEITLTNSVGVIDSGYRGEIMLKYKPLPTFGSRDKKNGPDIYNIGDRIGQIIIIPYPQVEFIETDELSSTERGENGFGSTN